ncbi:MAG: hypothetical protein ACW98K_17475 [Candidatus Kariarchaeaceae archaeon]
MSSPYTRFHVLFRGLLNEIEDDEEDEEVELGELDANAYDLRNELNLIQPNRDPKLTVDYLGIDGNVEMLFNYRITWIDRDADIQDYLDEAQGIIENGMDVLINEREFLGYTSE